MIVSDRYRIYSAVLQGVATLVGRFPRRMEGATPSAPSIGWLRRLDRHTAELTGCVPVFVRLEKSKPSRRRSALHFKSSRHKRR